MTTEERIRALLSTWTGIELPLGSVQSLDAFVRDRCSALGLASPERYLAAIGGPTSAEFQRLVNAVTVKYTWFFRDLPQIESLRQLLREPRERTLHVWVPGCASGEDVYTIALLAKETGADVRVLGTDVSSEAIELSRRAQFSAWSTRDVPEPLLRYFARATGQTLSPTAELRSKVSFQVHNVLTPAPMPPGAFGWDIILCRNVLMYFAQEKAQATAGALARALSDTGHLLLGASDVLIEPPPEVVVAYVAGRVVLRRGSRDNSGRQRGRTADRAASPARAGDATAVAPRAIVPAGAAAASRDERQSGDSALSAAHAYLSSGKIELARSAYVKACEAEPVSTEPRLYAGIAHYLSGDLPHALESLRAALLLDHRCWPASYYLGLCYESMGHARDAEREYERAATESEREQPIREDPSSPLFGFRRDLAWLARQRSRNRHTSP